MKLCRYDDRRLGVVRGDAVHDVTEALVGFDDDAALFGGLEALAPAILEAADESPPQPLSAVKLGPPVLRRGKIVAAPVNYRAHLDEARESADIHHGIVVHDIHRIGLFLKAASSVIGPSEPVRQRFLDRRTDHEVELAAVIGRRADRVSAEAALDHVAGYCIGLDMTLRGPEERSLRKSIDTYTVLGPWLVTADEVGAPTDLDLRLEVNGEVRQQANTRDLVMSVAELIAYASSFYTLEPGDVLLTGTPEGVGPVRPGDVMTASIARVGTMSIRVEAA